MSADVKVEKGNGAVVEDDTFVIFIMDESDPLTLYPRQISSGNVEGISEIIIDTQVTTNKFEAHGDTGSLVSEKGDEYYFFGPLPRRFSIGWNLVRTHEKSMETLGNLSMLVSALSGFLSAVNPAAGGAAGIVSSLLSLGAGSLKGEPIFSYLRPHQVKGITNQGNALAFDSKWLKGKLKAEVLGKLTQKKKCWLDFENVKIEWSEKKLDYEDASGKKYKPLDYLIKYRKMKNLTWEARSGEENKTGSWHLKTLKTLYPSLGIVGTYQLEDGRVYLPLVASFGLLADTDEINEVSSQSYAFINSFYNAAGSMSNNDSGISGKMLTKVPSLIKLLDSKYNKKASKLYSLEKILVLGNQGEGSLAADHEGRIFIPMVGTDGNGKCVWEKGIEVDMKIHSKGGDKIHDLGKLSFTLKITEH